jgi:hypothetical protein
MLTFLLNEYRDKMLREYRLRLSCLYLAFLGVIFLVGGVLSLPQYAALWSQKNGARIEKEAAQKATGQETGATSVEVKEIKSKLWAINENKDVEPVLPILETLLSKKVPGIAITTITLARKAAKGGIKVSGVAANREALVTFSKNLQSEPKYANAGLPVSSLAKNKDIPFTISIDSKF